MNGFPLPVSSLFWLKSTLVLAGGKTIPVKGICGLVHRNCGKMREYLPYDRVRYPRRDDEWYI